MLLDYAYLSLIFIEVKYLQIVFRATQTVDVAIFFFFFDDFSDIPSEIQLARHNTVSNWFLLFQSVWA